MDRAKPALDTTRYGGSVQLFALSRGAPYSQKNGGKVRLPPLNRGAHLRQIRVHVVRSLHIAAR